MKYYNSILSIGAVICSTYSISYGYASECIGHLNSSDNTFIHVKQVPKDPNFLDKIIAKDYTKPQSLELHRKITDEDSTRSKSLELYRKAFDEGQIDIKGEQYGIHLNDSLLTALKQDENGQIKTTFIEALKKLSQKNPGNKVQGYSLSCRNGKIHFTPFLGLNAK